MCLSGEASCSCSLGKASVLIKRGEKYEVPYSGRLDIVGHHPSIMTDDKIPAAYITETNTVSPFSTTGVLAISLCRAVHDGTRCTVAVGPNTYVHTLSSTHTQAGMHATVSVADDGLQLSIGQTHVIMWKLKRQPILESHKLVGVVIIGGNSSAVDKKADNVSYWKRIQNLVIDSTNVCELLDNDDDDWKEASVVGLTAGGHYKKLHLQSTGETFTATRFNEEREKRLKAIGLVRDRVEKQEGEKTNTKPSDTIDIFAAVCLGVVILRALFAVRTVYSERKKTTVSEAPGVQVPAVQKK